MPTAVRVEQAPLRPATRGVGARLWEIDFLRTFAIVLMVVYHVGYDIDLLAPQVGLDPFAGGWKVLQITCASTFLAVVGISFWVTDERARARGLAGLALWRAHARRGLEILAAALLVTVATLVALGSEDVVRFGILHLIATCVLIFLPLTVRLGEWNLLLGAAVVAAGLALNERDSTIAPLLVIGFDPGDAGVDWYPLLPWLGPVLIGAGLGAALYPGGERGPLLRGLAGAPHGFATVGWPGRHSLPIYLVHQPVLIVLTGMALELTGTDYEWP
jgi:uncharacterized membrane protein